MPSDFPKNESHELPDDLAFLAAQLQDDAQRLSRVYPPPQASLAHAAGDQPLSYPSTGLSFSGRLVTGGLLATALCGAVAMSMVFLTPPRSQTNSALTVREQGPGGPPRGSVSDAERTFSPDSIPVTPAAWLGDASGPEREAILDLYERDHQQVARLSF